MIWQDFKFSISYWHDLNFNISMGFSILKTLISQFVSFFLQSLINHLTETRLQFSRHFFFLISAKTSISLSFWMEGSIWIPKSSLYYFSLFVSCSFSNSALDLKICKSGTQKPGNDLAYCVSLIFTLIIVHSAININLPVWEKMQIYFFNRNTIK